MYDIYTVQSQDTLEKIANQFGTTIGVLAQINGFGSNHVLVPGNQLIVPVMRQQPYTYYTVKKGDNMYEIAKNNNIDYSLLLQLNGLEQEDYIYPNQAKYETSIYTVGKNNKLAKGTYWIKIQSYNGGNGYFTVKWK